MEKRLKKYLKNGKFDNVQEKTSRTMSAIRSKNARSTELCLRMLLVRSGIKGWQLHANKLPGNPDFYFKEEKLAVFVDGCYWHGCPKCGHIPKTRTEFWKAKIDRNKERDRKNNKELKNIGIRSLRIWEHELKKNTVEKVIKKINKCLKEQNNG